MKQWMKDHAKWFLISILVVAVIAPSSVAVASMISPAGQVFTGLRFFIDGVEMDVEWNEAENSVFLTTPQGVVPPVIVSPAILEGGQPMMEVAPWFNTSARLHANVRPSVNARGEVFTNVMHYRVGVIQGTYWYTDHALDNQFTLLTGTLLRDDTSTAGSLGFVRFIGDGRELASFTVNEDFGAQLFEVNVTGVNTLRIELSRTPGVTPPRFAIYNALLH